MGQKSNPTILRLNKTNQHWNSCWYSDDNYAAPFIQDCKINAYINSSQQQLERFSPVSFVKRQRGDLQIALFSAKPAQQFSKFKHNKYKNFTNNLITQNIFKKGIHYKEPLHKDDGLRHGLLEPMYESNRSSKLMGTQMDLLTQKKKEYFKSQLFLAMAPISYINSVDVGALKVVLDNARHERCKEKQPSPYILSKKNLSFFAKQVSNSLRESINPPTIKKAMNVKIVDPTRNHLEYSIYKYYNEYNVPFAPARSKLYLVKSPSIYQSPLFLASQVVSLLEERAVFRQIKHRIVREIRKNPIIKGVRIICSGRVASRSKKAQKARRESIQWGATSLNVFSEHVNFAHSFAQTTFGKIGVKVWISYNLRIH